MTNDHELWRNDFHHFLDESSTELSENAVAYLGPFILERLHRWRLFEIFPFIPGSLKLTTLRLSVRAQNLFAYRDLETFDDLGEMSIDTLLTWRNSGVTTVAMIIEQLCWASVSSALERGTDSAPEPDDGWSDSQMARVPRNVSLELLSSHLTAMSEWQAIRGTPSSSVLEPSSLVDPLPARVREARDWILELSAEGWRGSEYGDQRVAQLIASHLTGLGQRESTILMHRILSAHPATLDALGVELGVTRERVRQIESRLIGLLRSWVESDTRLGYYSLAVRQRIKKLSRMDTLLSQMPQLEETIEGTDMPAWYILDVFDDAIESDGVWIADPSLSEIKRRTVLTFQEVETAPSIASFVELREALSDLSHLGDKDLASWLTYCGFRRLLDHFVGADLKSIPELAYAYLHITGSPATIEEIHERTFPDRSLRSASNVILNDARIVRVGQHQIGLREWGVREYSGIRDAIDSVITAHSEISLDELIANITADFDVSPKSIVIYASSWPFETINGIVRRAEQSAVSAKPLSQTRNVYLVSDKLRLVISATADHLRGSGFAIASSLATALDLKPGEKKQLAASPSQITLTWMNTQPSLGSIRSQLQELDGAVGDYIAIDLGMSSATISKLPTDDIDDLRARLGLPADAELQSTFIASALGLSPSVPWAIVIQTLRDRGESGIADRIVADIGSNKAYDLAPASKSSKFRIISVDDA